MADAVRCRCRDRAVTFKLHPLQGVEAKRGVPGAVPQVAALEAESLSSFSAASFSSSRFRSTMRAHQIETS